MTTPGESGSRALWLRQIRAIIALEWQRYFLGKKALPLYLLAVMPVAFMLIRYLIPLDAEDYGSLADASELYSMTFQTLSLRFVVFFGCLVIFTNLFREEIASKSMHYYFLAPVRREVLTVGKYAAGLISAMVIFSLSTVASYLLALAPHQGAEISNWFTQGSGFLHLLTYVGITLLGCLGYGAVFLGMGILFKNPVVPAVLFYGLEWINFLLPALLKKFSVVHYLHSIVPVPLDQGPFAILADPTPTWLAITGILIFTALVLGVTSWVVRRMEIRYTTE
jgi:ABC-type transport system involved in multi-copper enzyme maturation permease subunit